jgi:hypothetical protein
MRAVCWLLLSLWSIAAIAADGRLRGSGGLISIDGAAGGGLVPWAVIAGHNERGEWDVVASASVVDTGDFNLRSGALAVGWGNRAELSLARISLGLDELVARGAFPDQRLDGDIIGAKLRLGGDLIYGGAPQFALGMQWRRARDPQLLPPGQDDQGIDVYLAASKLVIDGVAGRRTLASLTLRSTTAQQLGLVGFSDQRTLTLEGSLAIFVHSDWLIGAEYRSKPDRAPFAREDDWSDLFVAWMPSRHWHLALGYVDLGSIGGLAGQRGYYLGISGSP